MINLKTSKSHLNIAHSTLTQSQALRTNETPGLQVTDFTHNFHQLPASGKPYGKQAD
jgi:hypothetical protein